jgi:hypothetical protein
MKTILFAFSCDDHKAREVLSSVRVTLANQGYEALSTTELRPGDDWSKSSTEMIKRASAVIAFVNERGSNVLFEIGYAIGLGKNVLLVSDMSDLPSDLRTVSAVDARCSPTEIAFEIVRQVSRFEAHGWHMEAKLPDSLQEMLEARSSRPEVFELVSRLHFERAIAQEFTKQGFEVEVAQGAEFGYDFRLRDNRGRSMLVEVKKLNPNSKASISTVQQLLGAVHAYEDSSALLICTSEFTNSARDFASRQSERIVLWSLDELRRFVSREISAPDVNTLITMAK